ncbi:MAG: hypothetical protein ACRELA_23925 [Candidatus Rokuibacteriota bacterium]
MTRARPALPRTRPSSWHHAGSLGSLAGSTLATQTYARAERAKAQAANDFLIWATVAVTSRSSGQLLHYHGWQAVLTTAALLLGLAVAAMLAGTRRGTPPGRLGRARLPGEGLGELALIGESSRAYPADPQGLPR